MKKFYVVFAVLVLGSIWFGCGEDSDPCTELGDKMLECYKTACSGKDSCEACKAILNPQESSGSGEAVKCEGDVKTAAEKALETYDCAKDAAATALKTACP